MSLSPDAMHALMNPKSIAVIGASQRLTRGTWVLRNLRSTGFAGKVFCVHPRDDEIEGFSCYRSFAALPAAVDVLVVAIPAASIPDVLEDAYRNGICAAVVLASGFGDGLTEDLERVDRVRALAERGMAICGPNCFGVLNVATGAACYSGPFADPLLPGPIALISQSGGVCNLVSDPLMIERGIGFSYLVSCGNQLGISIEDYILYCLEDAGTRVVAAFVEGFREPWKLAQVAERSRELGKPVIVLKVGRTATGSRAALSHTGSISGSAEVLDSLLGRHNFVQTESIDEFCEAICAFGGAEGGIGGDEEIFVLSGSGGEGAHVADAAEVEGLRFAELSAPCRAELARKLPAFGVAENPFDATGAMYEDPALFPALLETMLDIAGDRLVAVNLVESPLTIHFAKALAAIAPTARHRLFAYRSSGLGAPDRAVVAALRDAGIPFVLGTQRAMRSIALMIRHRARRERPVMVRPAPMPVTLPSSSDGVLPFMTARELLSQVGIRVAETALTHSIDEAVEAAHRFGYPVVLKAESPQLPHKSDVGCVVVGCGDAESVRGAFETIVRNAETAGVPSLDGVLVQAMIGKVAEMFAGITVDPVLGPAVVFGTGGIFIEVLRDAVTEVAPIDEQVARGMIERVKGHALLTGARGTPPADIESLVRLLVSLGDLGIAFGDRLIAIDLNPIMVQAQGGGGIVVDAVFEMRAAVETAEGRPFVALD